jgi:hypothetical protein
LGQDSTRKRREDRLHKQRQEIEQEKKMAELVAATNSIRWNLGPSGTVVSFAEDVCLPNFFNTGPCRSHILPSFRSGSSNIDMKAGVLYLFLCSPGLVRSLHMELASQLSGGLRSFAVAFSKLHV